MALVVNGLYGSLYRQHLLRPLSHKTPLCLLLSMCCLKCKHSGFGRWVDFEELPITSSAGFSVNSINPARRHEKLDGHRLIHLLLLIFSR